MTAENETSVTFLDAVSSLVQYLHTPEMIAGYLIVLAFYGYQVFRKGWAEAVTEQAITGSLATMVILVLNLLFAPIVFVAVTLLQDAYSAFSIPSIPGTLWSGMPFWLVAIIAIIAYDFADYWNHRLMHVSFLWPIHAIHHSDHEVNGLTTFRIHFLESLVMQTSYILLLSWMGIPPEAAALGAMLTNIHNIYVHCDLDWDHGPFKLLIASPRFHRWHHADNPAIYGKNLANLMPVYDYLFGTYLEAGTCKEKMGAPGVPHADVVALILYPFAEWSRSIRRITSRHNRNSEANSGKAAAKQ